MSSEVLEQSLPSAIPWFKVASAPNREQVESALKDAGYVLVNNPFGSFFVTRENRNHPEYKLSQAFLVDLEKERQYAEGMRLLKEQVTLFLQPNSIRPEDGQEIARTIQNFLGMSGNPQFILMQYFAEHFGDGPTAVSYAHFRRFTKLADIAVDNNSLGWAVDFHSAWHEAESKRVKSEVVNSTVEQALANNDRRLAIQIIMQTNRVDYRQAEEMVNNMIKLRSMTKALTKT